MTSDKQAEVIENLSISMYDLLKDANYETSSNILIGHLQRVICDKANNDPKECLNLTDDVINQLNSRIETVNNMKPIGG